MAVCTHVPVIDSYLGVLIIEIDRLCTKQANNTPKTCVHAGMAVRVIKDHRTLTENSPQRCFRGPGDGSVRVSDRQTLIRCWQIRDEKCGKR